MFSYHIADGDKLRAAGHTPRAQGGGQVLLQVHEKREEGSRSGSTGNDFLAQLLTRDLLEVELVDGIRGEVVDFVWNPRQRAPASLKFVVVQLGGYIGPA